jgi:hypothetical protein
MQAKMIPTRPPLARAVVIDPFRQHASVTRDLVVRYLDAMPRGSTAIPMAARPQENFAAGDGAVHDRLGHCTGLHYAAPASSPAGTRSPMGSKTTNAYQHSLARRPRHQRKTLVSIYDNGAPISSGAAECRRRHLMRAPLHPRHALARKFWNFSRGPRTGPTAAAVAAVPAGNTEIRLVVHILESPCSAIRRSVRALFWPLLVVGRSGSGLGGLLADEAAPLANMGLLLFSRHVGGWPTGGAGFRRRRCGAERLPWSGG